MSASAISLKHLEQLQNRALLELSPVVVQDTSLLPEERLHLVKAMLLSGESPVSGNPLRNPTLFYPGLRGQSVYSPAEFGWVRPLLQHVDEIRSELHSLEATSTGRSFQTAWPGYTRVGMWTILWLRLYGDTYAENVSLAPHTIRTVDAVPNQAGWVCFSALEPHTHISAHCGVTNAKLRCHVALEMLPGLSRIRIGKETQFWRRNEVIIFDDSFEHEVWNDSDQRRVVLIFDIYHPDLTQEERAFLSLVEELTLKDDYRALVQSFKVGAV